MTRSLPASPGNSSRQAQRLDDLLGLAQVAVRAASTTSCGQEARADELLGDRRGAALAGARRVLGDGRDEGGEVDAGVVPERAVLGGRRRVEDEGRDVVVARRRGAAGPGTDRARPCRRGRRRSSAGRTRGSSSVARVGQAGRQDAERRDRDDHRPGRRATRADDATRRATGQRSRPAPRAPGAGDGAIHSARGSDEPRRPGHAGSPGTAGTARRRHGACADAAA